VPLFSRNLKRMSAFPILSSIRRFGRVSWLSLAIVSTVVATLTLSHLHISINADKANDTSPWFWWINQPTVLNQVVANLQPKPKKKVAKSSILPSESKVVCTCCKVHTFEITRKAI
jgi:hypothetical protein